MKLRYFLTAMLSLLPALGFAHFLMPEKAPVKKLVATMNAVVAKYPDDAEAHYTLGRVHYLAFVTTASELDWYRASGDERVPSIAPLVSLSRADMGSIWREAKRRVLAELKLAAEPEYSAPGYEGFSTRLMAVSDELKKSGWQSPGLPDAAGSEHLAKALPAFRRAMKLDSKKAIYQLGYASLLEQASAWAKLHPQAEVPGEIRRLNRSNILGEYKMAWEMELSDDMKEHENRGMLSPFNMVSYEAGSAYVRLAERDEASLTVLEKKQLAKIRSSLDALKKDTGRAITPLILATRAVGGIDDLLAPERSVGFPLRGWGPDGRWTWLKPDTALLVWNPSGSGKVVSGAQLFGGYTWEIFWRNGYEPLAVLDADGDAMLRADELAGIALWFDRNSNGVSDPGEVQTLAEAGITALSTRPTATDGIHPTNSAGVTFGDGRVLPTWDWMARPAADPKP